MKNERGLELVSAAADSELAPDEQAELERILQDSPEARLFQADLDSIEQIFASEVSAEPPAGLHERIMSGVRMPITGTDRSASILEWLRNLSPGPVLRYGFATAAGLLVAVTIYENRPQLPESADGGALVGTMVRHSAQHPQILGKFSYREAGIDSLVQVERRQDALVLDFQIETDKPVDVTIDFARSGVEVASLIPNSNPFESIEVADQVVRVRATGDGRLTTVLHRRENADYAGKAKILLEYSSSGELLKQGSARTNLVIDRRH